VNRIQLLDDLLINRIAAGEVVERPASVVKELVENSIDAGAARIDVLVEGGGKRRIEVRDDGEGMATEDVFLAVTRHATSKLTRAEDLDRIGTLGFRGEALASIASISHFTLKSARSDGEGVEVFLAGGKSSPAKAVGMPRGTTVRVDRLFFNVPARRKFLRTDTTELQHITRWMQRFALVCFPLGFTLKTDTRTILQAPPAADPAERLAQILGKKTAATMLPVHWEGDGLSIHGFAARPGDAASRRDQQLFFVNGRAVQDRTLMHAANAAYENVVARGKRPAMVLFLELDAEAVDVNVHPQKTEVRFREGGRIHAAVKAAIGASQAEQAATPAYATLRPSTPLALSLAEQAPPVSQATTVEPVEREAVRVAVPQQESWWSTDTDAAPGVLGQYDAGYIVAQDREGLVLVDPHAAHERVLFEKYLDEAEQNHVETQALMFPVTVELSAAEALAFEQEVDEFRRLGFDLAAFGNRTIRIDGVPALTSSVDTIPLFRELLGEVTDVKSVVARPGELRKRLVTTAACHAAVKISHRLEMRAMRKLLSDLGRCDHPTTCPHGRPTRFRLTQIEIERAFGRR
jgi:DNA mismatch repair protein MutL